MPSDPSVSTKFIGGRLPMNEYIQLLKLVTEKGITIQDYLFMKLLPITLNPAPSSGNNSKELDNANIELAKARQEIVNLKKSLEEKTARVAALTAQKEQAIAARNFYVTNINAALKEIRENWIGGGSVKKILAQHPPETPAKQPSPPVTPNNPVKK